MILCCSQSNGIFDRLIHFVVICSKHDALRKQFVDTYYRKRPKMLFFYDISSTNIVNIHVHISLPNIQLN